MQDHTVEKVRNHGWRVTLAALGINLALGILYTWSVISKSIPEQWQWSEAEKSWPYALACLVFSLVMVPAGKMQDRFGPRVVASIGGLLVGAGLILASLTTSSLGYLLGFGLLTGAGIGFGYASATPPAVKWFPPHKTGLIAGIVVSGFGLASVYAAPLARSLANAYGIQTMALLLGIAFLVVIVVLAQLLVAPPEGYVPEGSCPTAVKIAAQHNYTPREMLHTRSFYQLWFMYACGAGAGLMVIAKLAMIAREQAALELGFILVAVLALGNGGGRILAGSLSDKFGRQYTLFGFFMLQCVMIVLLSWAVADSLLGSITAMCIISALIGANYGANLAVFPSITKDFYGLKHFGMNYGLIFTAWGFGGFMLALAAGRLYDVYQTFSLAYYGASALLLAAAITTLLVHRPPSVEAPKPGRMHHPRLKHGHT